MSKSFWYASRDLLASANVWRREAFFHKRATLDGIRLMAGRGRGGEGRGGEGRGQGEGGEGRGERGGGGEGGEEYRVEERVHTTHNDQAHKTVHKLATLRGTGTVPTLSVALDGHPEVLPLLSKLRCLYPLLAVSWLKVCCY